MNTALKFLSLSLLCTMVNFLSASSAAADETAPNPSAAVSVTPQYVHVEDIGAFVTQHKNELILGFDGTIDYISKNATQFLADCVPVGGEGQPVDRSVTAFKAALRSAIMRREVYIYGVHEGKVNVNVLKGDIRNVALAAIDEFVGLNLRRCGDEMLHHSVQMPGDNRTSIGFMELVHAAQ